MSDFNRDKRKKRKTGFKLDDEGSNSTTPVTDETRASETAEQPSSSSNVDFGRKKKKTRTFVLDEGDAAGGAEGAADNAVQEQLYDPYLYDFLLTRVYTIMKEKNPNLVSGEIKKTSLIPPRVARIGTKKTALINFPSISKGMKRQDKHLMAYLFSEMGTTGSTDASGQLILKGKYSTKQFENVLRNYAKEYVICHTCRSSDTLLEKTDRLTFLKCNACNSTLTVSTIKSGFQAVTGKRAAIRARVG